MNRVSWTVFENRLLAAKTSVDAGTLAMRLTTVLLALGILFWRTPKTFINPQFWGEDVVFFHGARIDGWTSITHLVAGYLTSIQYLVAVLASYASAVVAPAIYCTAAVFLTLLVVWLVTSPRLDLPSKPLLALAVVVVPMGGEELGQLCNIQWVLPIGAFAMLFMRASNSNAVLAGEVVYIGLMATSGPFSIFLAPMFAWQTFLADTAAERRRLILLTAVVASGGLLQGLEIATHPIAIAPEPYSWTLWVTIPLRRIMTTFSVASRHLEGLSGATVGTICLAVAAVLACIRPYRTQKIFMLLFSLLIVIGGMYKFRDALAGQISGQRYFYAASIFSLWFICCLSARPPVQMGLSAFVAIVQLIDLRGHSRPLKNRSKSAMAGVGQLHFQRASGGDTELAPGLVRRRSGSVQRSACVHLRHGLAATSPSSVWSIRSPAKECRPARRNCANGAFRETFRPTPRSRRGSPQVGHGMPRIRQSNLWLSRTPQGKSRALAFQDLKHRTRLIHGPDGMRSTILVMGAHRLSELLKMASGRADYLMVGPCDNIENPKANAIRKWLLRTEHLLCSCTGQPKTRLSVRSNGDLEYRYTIRAMQGAKNSHSRQD